MAARTGFPGLPDAGGTPREVAAVFNQMLRRQSTFTMFGAGVSNLGNTSGTTGSFNGPLIIAGGNNITLSQSTDANGGTATISGPNMMAAGISNLGNTAGSSGLQSQQLVLVGTNGITLSGSTNASGQATVSFSGGGGGGAFSGGVSNLGNTAGSTGVTGTRLVFVGTNNISLSQSTDANGGTISISGAGGGGGNFSGGVSNLGNTAGSTGITGTRLVFVGTNAVSLSQSTDANGGTVSFNVATQTAESNTFGMSNLGNTSGTSGVVSGNQVRYLFAGGNNITLSQSLNGVSGTVTISAFNQSAESNTMGMSNLGNTSGTSGVISGNQLQMLFAGGNNITLSQSINGSSATITISGAAGGGGGGGTLSFWEPFQYIGQNTALSQLGNGSWQFKHLEALQNYSVTRGNIYASISQSTITNNSTRTASIFVYMGIYTRNASTLSMLSSGSTVHTWTFSSNAGSGSFTGVKRISVPITINATPGDYWIGIATRSSGSNASFTGSIYQHAGVALFNGDLGANTSATHQWFLGHGVWSASSSNVPASVAFSHITGSNATTQRYPIFNFQNFIA